MQHETTPRYLRISEIVTTRRKGKPVRRGILSVSPATYWAWVKSGRAPQPIKLSPGVTVWRYADVVNFAESLAKAAM